MLAELRLESKYPDLEFPYGVHFPVNMGKFSQIYFINIVLFTNDLYNHLMYVFVNIW